MRWRWIVFLHILLTLTVSVAAQGELCPPLVRDALDQLGDNCSGLSRNSACYGFTRVESSFVTEQAADFFTVPSDQAALVELKTLATRPLDLSLAQWGIAVMSVQANVPSALPGQAVIFLLMGDTEVSNQVEPSTALTPFDPVSVQIQSETRVFSAPDRSSNVLTTVASGSALAADALSPDADWLRVMTDAGLGWIRRQTINADAGLSGLAVA
jgi:hypothetical protein